MSLSLIAGGKAPKKSMKASPAKSKSKSKPKPKPKSKSKSKKR